jgi:hypothetical protein
VQEKAKRRNVNARKSKFLQEKANSSKKKQIRPRRSKIVQEEAKSVATKSKIPSRSRVPCIPLSHGYPLDHADITASIAASHPHSTRVEG